MEPEPSVLKDLITEAIADCTDVGLLDLIYKLITYETIEGQSP